MIDENKDAIEFLINTIDMEKKKGKSISEVETFLRDTLGIKKELIETSIKNFKERTSNIRKTKIKSSYKKNKEDWYLGPKKDDKYWPRLKEYLSKEKCWEKEVVNSIDNVSNIIVSSLEPPLLDSFNTRGLVLGYIQSGKTANYISVISKAADVDYKFFIILAGITNTLRRQTQSRVNNEITNLNSDDWYSLTSLNNDFSSNDAESNINALLTNKAHQKIICVVKKNTYVLQYLKDWLNKAKDKVLKNCPTLVIDDEADHASINVSKEEDERSRINSLIIGILKSLKKVAYIGYTATPFANVLINPTNFEGENLYPRDFIISLPKPDNYFGAETIFGRERLSVEKEGPEFEGLDIIRIVPDEELNLLQPSNREDSDFFQPKITNSLEDSILYFWLATTVRYIRENQEKNSTMLIHTTRLTEPQLKFENLLSKFKNKVKEQLINEDKQIYERLEQIWNYEIEAISPEENNKTRIPFSEIKEEIKKVVISTEIYIQNSRTDDDILADYKVTYKPYIVVGGDILSRGLTLEGLTVSYFIRISHNYDTLLQMGRWFGYHDKYKDLIRIWMTEDLERFFFHLATIEKEIRKDIKRYQETDLTPKDISVRIRTHPTLNVTSPLKSRGAIPAKVSYSGQKKGTIYFKNRDRDWLLNNQEAVRNLIEKVRKGGLKVERSINHYLFRGVDLEYIIDFFKEYKIEESHSFNNETIIKYLKDEERREKHDKWNIVILNKKNAKHTINNLGLNKDIGLLNRTKVKFSLESKANIKGIVSKRDTILDIIHGTRDPVSDEKIKKELGIDEDQTLSARQRIKFREKILPNRGLLLIYPIDKDSIPTDKSTKSEKLDAKEHVMGIGIYFPDVDNYNLDYIQAKLD